MKPVFVLSILVFLMLPLSLVKANEGNECIVVIKGGRMEIGEPSKNDGYVILQKKEVKGKLLKKGAWLRIYRKDGLGSLGRRKFSGIYLLMDMWKEGSGFFIVTKYHKHTGATYDYISPTSSSTRIDKDQWRVVKN